MEQCSGYFLRRNWLENRLRWSVTAHRPGTLRMTDIADAFYTAAMSDVVQDTFNVGSGGTYSVNRLCELLGGEITHIPKRPGEPDCTFADTSKIENRLGWKAKVSFEEGVQKVLDNIDYWRAAPVWTPDSIGVATEDWFKYLGDQAE